MSECDCGQTNQISRFPLTIQTKKYGLFSLSHIENDWDAIYLGNELITHGTKIRMYEDDGEEVSFTALLPEYMRIDENDDRLRGFGSSGIEQDMCED